MNKSYLGLNSIFLFQNHRIQVRKFYSFGSLLPGRKWEPTSTDKYRFGFNGKEVDDETFGRGNELDFGERIYDPRLGKWMSIDPLFAKYPGSSPYNYALSNPICFIDIGGMDVVIGINPGTPGGSFSLLGIQALQQSKTISNFVNQFTSTTRGSQGFQVNTITKTDGQFSNNVNLIFTSIQRTPGAIAAMAGQDAQTTFTYRLASGAMVAAPLYNPAVDGAVTGVDVNIAVLEDNFTNMAGFLGNSNGNSRCLAAAYTSLAIANELYTDVDNFINIMQANTGSDGTINYVGVSTALAAAGAPPVSPAMPAALNDLAVSNDNKKSGFMQWSTTSNDGILECMDTKTTGDVLQTAIPIGVGMINTQNYVFPAPLMVPVAAIGSSDRVSATPDSQRTFNPTNECQ